MNKNTNPFEYNILEAQDVHESLDDDVDSNELKHLLQEMSIRKRYDSKSFDFKADNNNKQVFSNIAL